MMFASRVLTRSQRRRFSGVAVCGRSCLEPRSGHRRRALTESDAALHVDIRYTSGWSGAIPPCGQTATVRRQGQPTVMMPFRRDRERYPGQGFLSSAATDWGPGPVTEDGPFPRQVGPPRASWWGFLASTKMGRRNRGRRCSRHGR